MYYGAARDVCDVRYYAVDADGTRSLVDRFEALGYDHFYEAKRPVRRISDRAHVERQARQICREWLPRGQHLEADARCGSYRGWKPERFEGPLCSGTFDASARPRDPSVRRRGMGRRGGVE
jgi:hypothetical protein